MAVVLVAYSFQGEGVSLYHTGSGMVECWAF